MKNIILSLIIALFAVSCTKVLDKGPLGNYSDNVVWTDPVLCDKYLLECYAEMGFYNEMQQYGNHDDFGGNTTMVSLGISDEATSAWVPTPKSHWININGGIYEWWGYDIVRKLNIFIEKDKNLPYNSEDLRSCRLAEARFLRAFSYFQMVKRYGGVPLVTKVLNLNDSENDLYPARAKEEDVYQFIIDELNSIIDNNLLPTSADGADAGRPTKWAAAALKSRAAMYAGSIASWGELVPSGVVGIPKAKASYFWQQSLDASNLIINNGPFSLFNKYIQNNPTSDDYSKNYRNIFIDENNSEVIFAERFDGKSGKGHSWDHWQNPAGYNAWSGGQQNSVYLEFVESYENIDGSDPKINRAKIAANHQWTLDELFGKKDPRFKGSVYTQGSSWTHGGAKVTLDYHVGIFLGAEGWIYDGNKDGVPAVGFNQSAAWRPTPFGILKYLNEAEALVPERFYSNTDWIVFRLGEIYMNKAEAAFALNDEPASRAAVNEIRKRAGMPLYTSPVSLDKIHNERKIELAFEGNRYWDLRRWRKAEAELTHAWSGLQFGLDWASKKYYLTITENIAGLPAPYFLKMHYYLPIALGRTSQNKNLEQNPHYR